MEYRLEGIGHCFDKRHLLKDIELTINSGQCLVVSGRSGSGKSLLFSILCGVFTPDQGQVLVDGVAIEQMNHDQYMAFRKYLGAVFQVSALISNLTLAENLMLKLNQHGENLSIAQKHQMVFDACHEFGLEDYLELRTDQLSVGLASLAGLARALVIPPKCLIWDAPMAEIDLHWSEHVCNRLKWLKACGTTLILFSNRQRLIEQFADLHLDLSGKTLRQLHCGASNET